MSGGENVKEQILAVQRMQDYIDKNLDCRSFAVFSVVLLPVVSDLYWTNACRVYPQAEAQPLCSAVKERKFPGN